MSEHSDAFEQKLQRLRHTGVGGVQTSNGEWGPKVPERGGERGTRINMKVEKGWAVANPVAKKGVSQSGDNKQIRNDGPVKVFAISNMEKTPQPEPPQQSIDTEESIIKEIIILQKKLAALKNK